MGVLRISSEVRDADPDQSDQPAKAKSTSTSNDVADKTVVDGEGLWGSLPRDVNDAVLGAVDVSELQASCGEDGFTDLQNKNIHGNAHACSQILLSQNDLRD